MKRIIHWVELLVILLVVIGYGYIRYPEFFHEMIGYIHETQEQDVNSIDGVDISISDKNFCEQLILSSYEHDVDKIELLIQRAEQDSQVGVTRVKEGNRIYYIIKEKNQQSCKIQGSLTSP